MPLPKSCARPGLAKADKKAARIAAEGALVTARSADGKRAALAEVNCETDFVAREPEFQAFASQVAEAALAAGASEPEAIAALRPRRRQDRGRGAART